MDKIHNYNIIRLRAVMVRFTWLSVLQGRNELFFSCFCWRGIGGGLWLDDVQRGLWVVQLTLLPFTSGVPLRTGCPWITPALLGGIMASSGIWIRILSAAETLDCFRNGIWDRTVNWERSIGKGRELLMDFEVRQMAK